MLVSVTFLECKYKYHVVEVTAEERRIIGRSQWQDECLSEMEKWLSCAFEWKHTVAVAVAAAAAVVVLFYAYICGQDMQLYVDTYSEIDKLRKKLSSTQLS